MTHRRFMAGLAAALVAAPGSASLAQSGLGEPLVRIVPPTLPDSGADLGLRDNGRMTIIDPLAEPPSPLDLRRGVPDPLERPDRRDARPSRVLDATDQASERDVFAPLTRAGPDAIEGDRILPLNRTAPPAQDARR